MGLDRGAEAFGSIRVLTLQMQSNAVQLIGCDRLLDEGAISPNFSVRSCFAISDLVGSTYAGLAAGGLPGEAYS